MSVTDRICFICNICPITTDPLNSDDDNRNDRKLFALKVVFEMPLVYLNGVEGTEKNNGLVFCRKCLRLVCQAHDNYLEMTKILEQFRTIQRQLVSEIRGSRKSGNNRQFAKRRNHISGPSVKWREFIFEHEYDFTGPFVIGIGLDYEDDFEFKEESNDAEELEEEEKADITEHHENIISHEAFTSTIESPAPSDLHCGVSADRMEDASSSCDETIYSEEAVKIKSENEISDWDWEPPPIKEMLFQSDKYGSDVSMGIREEKHTSALRRNEKRACRKTKLEARTYGGDDDAVLLLKTQTKRNAMYVRVRADKPTSSQSTASRQNKKPKMLKKFIPKPAPEHVACELCEKTFSKSDIRAHMRDHIGEEYLHKCPNLSCPLAFSSSFALFKHLKERNCSDITQSLKFLGAARKVGLLSCKQCPSKLHDASELRVHLQLRHELAENTLSCPVSGCQEKFTIRQSVDVHIFLQHDMIERTRPEKFQKCDECKKRVKEISDHLKMEHGAKEILKCHQCTFLFATREHLTFHLYSVHRYSGVPLICDICTGKGEEHAPTFQNHLQLREHYCTHHKIGKKFMCSICGSGFWTQSLLDYHTKGVHKKKSFECMVCNGLSNETSVTFNSKRALDTHNIKIHGAEPLKCKICQMTFTSSQSIQRHVRAEHKRNSMEPIRCEITGCGKVLKTQQLLRRHHTAVHGEIKHVCAECGKGYTNANALKYHHESVHNLLGQRKFVCEACGEGFVKGTHLKIHMLIHTGERPFECPRCGQKFRQKGVLTRHLKSHEGKGDAFKPTGPMKHIRKRVERK